MSPINRLILAADKVHKYIDKIFDIALKSNYNIRLFTLKLGHSVETCFTYKFCTKLGNNPLFCQNGQKWSILGENNKVCLPDFFISF